MLGKGYINLLRKFRETQKLRLHYNIFMNVHHVLRSLYSSNFLISSGLKRYNCWHYDNLP